MKTILKEYSAPRLYEHQMFIEGLLCTSGILDGDNESYGGVPGDDETIF